MEATQKSKHIEWIDVAKGIGIFLICCGHMFYEAPTRIYQHVTYSFLSAFFFVLSGFVFSMRKETTFLKFSINKVKRILIPTIIFVVLGLIFAIIFYHVYDPIRIVRYLFFYDGTYQWNIPCWFFVSLFFAYIICYLLKFPKQKPWVKVLIMIGFYILGFLVFSQKKYIEFDKNPFVRFGIDRTIIVTGFFMFGNVLRDLYDKMDGKVKFRYYVMALIPLAAIWILFGYFLNSTTSIYERKLGNYWHYILAGTFGVPTFLIISMLITYLKPIVPVLKAWGKNTILIAGTHYMCRWARNLLALFTKSVGIANTHWVSLIIPFYIAAILLLLIPIGKLIDKYIPWMTGVDPVFYRELRAKKAQNNANNQIN